MHDYGSSSNLNSKFNASINRAQENVPIEIGNLERGSRNRRVTTRQRDIRLDLYFTCHRLNCRPQNHRIDEICNLTAAGGAPDELHLTSNLPDAK